MTVHLPAASDAADPSPRPPQPPSAQPEPRERARAARRQALLEAAENVFAERGFSRATMSDIAARAGYSAGNIYNVFEGKDALFAEVLSTRANEILELVRVVLQSDEPLGCIIDRYVDTTLELVEAHRGFFVMLTQTSPDFDWGGSASRDSDLRADLDAQLEGAFRRAMERGEIPSGNPRPYACLLQGSLNGHVAHWFRNRHDRDHLWGSANALRTLLRRAMGLPQSD